MITIERDQIEAMPLLKSGAAAVRDAFVAVTDGRATVPPVGYLALPGKNADCHIKFGYIDGDPIFVVKVASGFYDNPAKGLPSSNGLMLAISAETGETLAFLDDKGLLTDIRTGLGGAIATRALARDDISVVGIVGTGTQARFQIKALTALYDRPLRFVVWGRSLSRGRELSAELSHEGLSVEATDDLQALCLAADAIVTTTPSTTPLIRSEWVTAGTHITAIGADAPGKQELDIELVARADRLVSDLANQSHGHGEFSHASKADLLYPDRCVELGAVLSGAGRGRMSASQITIADLTGLATQDIAITRTVLEEVGLLGR